MRAVVDAQNALTESVLAQCDTRDRFKALMTQLYDYPRFGCALQLKHTTARGCRLLQCTTAAAQCTAKYDVLLDP